MKILMLSSEASPYAKTGGLADAVSAMSAALSARGHDLRILLPLYGQAAPKDFSPLGTDLRVDTAGTMEEAEVFQGRLPGSRAIVYLLSRPDLYARGSIYGEYRDFPDNPRRFSFLCRAAFALCRATAWIPDVLHLHDWPAAPAAAYLREIERYRDFSRAASILTVHNLGFQGIFPEEAFPQLALPWEAYHGMGFEHYKRVNLLKAGIQNADMVTTVSPTYAREIQTPAGGFGLDGILRDRSRRLVGILNGIDMAEWNPADDKSLASTYSTWDLSGKAACKAALQREFGLPERAEVPLLAFASRLSEQKGIRELFHPGAGSAAMICADMDVQFVAAGSGEAWCERELTELSARLPNFKAKPGYDEAQAHRIKAGADFILMPCRYEPCGLNQMYSMRYGTLPIARRTGGLADTVRNYNQDSGDGSGFMLDDLTPRSVYDTVGWAVWTYFNRREHLDAMRLRAMSQDFSWDDPVREYESLYAQALAGRS